MHSQCSSDEDMPQEGAGGCGTDAETEKKEDQLGGAPNSTTQSNPANQEQFWREKQKVPCTF